MHDDLGVRPAREDKFDIATIKKIKDEMQFQEIKK
jgi:hypothetical protein